MDNPLILALDVPSVEKALDLSLRLAPHLGAVKIGSELFTTAGPGLVRQIRATGQKVFLDLKFHDIPNTVAKAVTAAVQLDIQMLTVHTSGGRDMMRAAQEAAEETAARMGRPAPLVLGVTVLTSLDDRALGEVGVSTPLPAQVERLAQLAVQSGLRGLVCSPLELAPLRAALPASVQLVTPGIRPPGVALDDQKRTLAPREALQRGASWLVIGRPIYGAENPALAAEQILRSLV